MMTWLLDAVGPAGSAVDWEMGVGDLPRVVVLSGDGEEEQADYFADDEGENWWRQGNVG
jgi:hypothetical protein